MKIKAWSNVLIILMIKELNEDDNLNEDNAKETNEMKKMKLQKLM